MSHLHFKNRQQRHLHVLMLGVQCPVTSDDTEFKNVSFQPYQKTLELADSKLGNMGNLRRGQRGILCTRGSNS
jgi:hypothetical protein